MLRKSDLKFKGTVKKVDKGLSGKKDRDYVEIVDLCFGNHEELVKIGCLRISTEDFQGRELIS